MATSENPKASIPAWVFALLSLGVSATLVTLLIVRFKASAVLCCVQSVSSEWILAAIGVSFASVLVRVLRWKLLLARSKNDWSLRQLFPITLTGYLFSLISPGGMGEIGRAYYAKRRFGHGMEMLSSSVLDKWSGLTGAFVLGLWASLAAGETLFAVVAFLGVVVLLIALLALQRFHMLGIQPLIDRMTKRPGLVALFQVQCRPRNPVLIGCLMLAVLGWLLTYFQLFLMYQGLAAPLRLRDVYTVGPLLTLVSLVPVGWGGIGSRDVAAVVLFQKMGIAAHTTVAACLLFNLTAVIIPALFGALVVVWEFFKMMPSSGRSKKGKVLEPAQGSGAQLAEASMHHART